GVFIEAFVFGGDEGIDDIGRDILEFDVAAVALVLIVFAHGGAVFGEDLGGQGDGRVLQLFEGRQGAEDAQVDEDQEQDEGSQSIEKDLPENSDESISRGHNCKFKTYRDRLPTGI